MSEHKTKDQVFDLAIKGESIKEMSEACGITEASVKYHLNNFYRTYGVKTQTKFMHAVFQEKLTSLQSKTLVNQVNCPLVSNQHKDGK